MEAEKYQLKCVAGGEVVVDRYTNTCPEGHESLLRTVYRRKQIRKRSGLGMFNYIDWLPVDEAVPTNASPITYKSGAFGQELGLNELYISFSGYWPERGAYLKTCTFKELEALPTVQRVKERAGGKIVTVASAGNTSRAFAAVSSATGMPVLAVVPSSSLTRMWTTTGNHAHIFLIAVDGDYSDAIAVGKQLAKLEGLVEEGGVKNVARRDGMGVVELEAAFAMRGLPAFYFQAVGSGAGAIAAWEAFDRLIVDGRFGARMPRIVIAQNLPFAPMVSAWQAGRAELIAELDMKDAEQAIRQLYADVLSTRNPPYAITGGVYDMLSNTAGMTYGITNAEAREAERLFEAEEGIDLDPAAAVAVASLLKAVAEGVVKREDRILLNITGGGYKRVKQDCTLYHIEKRMALQPAEWRLDDVERELREFVRAL
ncbi:MAG TPA: cysteate synthase [Methanomicrobia archaeon]|nr:cysteate synthase [Methanomicrobia archaeon]